MLLTGFKFLSNTIDVVWSLEELDELRSMPLPKAWGRPSLCWLTVVASTDAKSMEETSLAVPRYPELFLRKFRMALAFFFWNGISSAHVVTALIAFLYEVRWAEDLALCVNVVWGAIPRSASIEPRNLL